MCSFYFWAKQSRDTSEPLCLEFVFLLPSREIQKSLFPSLFFPFCTFSSSSRVLSFCSPSWLISVFSMLLSASFLRLLLLMISDGSFLFRFLLTGFWWISVRTHVPESVHAVPKIDPHFQEEDSDEYIVTRLKKKGKVPWFQLQWLPHVSTHFDSGDRRASARPWLHLRRPTSTPIWRTWKGRGSTAWSHGRWSWSPRTWRAGRLPRMTRRSGLLISRSSSLGTSLPRAPTVGSTVGFISREPSPWRWSGSRTRRRKLELHLSSSSSPK